MTNTAILIGLVAMIFAVGVLAQVFSERFQVPSIVFLIAAGLVLGPEGLGIVTRDVFGTALPVIVGLAVAIIVFEGAYNLRASELLSTRRTRLRFITVGALIALIGTTLVIRVALNTPWDLAFLIGSLLVATGPTVIEPILEVVPVRDRVEKALSFEGVVNDVTAAILAVVAFELVLASDPTEIAFLREFTIRLALGIITGVVVAAGVRFLIRYVDRSPGNVSRNVRLLVLTAALVSYAGAELLAEEAGIAAAATAGVVLGNSKLPYDDTVAAFKGDITQFTLSFVFIILAALLTFDDISALGISGFFVVVAVIVVIRPLLVFVSTAGQQFTNSERLFMSFVAPRGIIPASVATLFAVELTNAGLNSEATTLVGTVFLVILATVVIEGGFASVIAQVLDVIPMRVLIVGGGTVGRGLANRFEERGENVVIVEEDSKAVQRGRSGGHSVHVGDGTNREVLTSAGIENTKLVIVATGDDDRNLLAAQLATSTFGVEQVFVRVNDPKNLDVFEDLDVRTISPTLATVWAIDSLVERPALSNWMFELSHTGDVQETEVTSEERIGQSIGTIRAELPNGCLLAIVSRDGSAHIPDDEFELELGDTITLIGQKDAVESALTQLKLSSK